MGQGEIEGGPRADPGTSRMDPVTTAAVTEPPTPATSTDADGRPLPPVLSRLLRGSFWLALRSPIQALLAFWSIRLIVGYIGDDANGAYQFAWGFGFIQFLLEFARKRRCTRIVFVYEASGQGYGLYDLLTAHGIECHVLSPTHLPKTAKGKRNKTDAKDAQMLLEQARSHVLAGNPLPMVWTPPQALRNDRELV